MEGAAAAPSGRSWLFLDRRPRRRCRPGRAGC
jgi:hypothetical protein